MKSTKIDELIKYSKTLECFTDQIVNSFIKINKRKRNIKGEFVVTKSRINNGVTERVNKEIKKILIGSGSKLKKEILQ